MTSKAVWAVVLPSALVVTLLSATQVLGTCSTTGLQAVQAEMRAATAPPCGSKALRRAFGRARHRASIVTARAVRECARQKTPDVGSADRALKNVLAKSGRSAAAGEVPQDCVMAYEAILETLDADLEAAANGAEGSTTTTAPPGTPTTTTLQPACITVTLEVDKGDCTSVTSEPPGFVDCGASCDDRDFTVPASRPLRLKGTPAPGDSSVFFDTDCDDDGTVPIDTATPPDCSLSCDCNSQ